MSRAGVGLVLLAFTALAHAACLPGTVARGVYTKYCYPVATRSGSGGGYDVGDMKRFPALEPWHPKAGAAQDQIYR